MLHFVGFFLHLFRLRKLSQDKMKVVVIVAFLILGVTFVDAASKYTRYGVKRNTELRQDPKRFAISNQNLILVFYVLFRASVITEPLPHSYLKVKI